MNDRGDIEAATWWLELALGDLRAAKALAATDGAPGRLAAGLAQQAAEKALKARIALGGAEPPRTHGLTLLARQLGPGSAELAQPADLVALTDAYRAGRYPEVADPPFEADEVAALIESAESIVAAIVNECAHHDVDIKGLEPR